MISDISIGIRPSKRLIDFIKNLNDSKLELPENLLKLYREFTNDNNNRKIFKEEISIPTLNNEERKFVSELQTKITSNELKTCLNSLIIEEDSSDEIEIISDENKSGKNHAKRERAKQHEMEKLKLLLNLNDLKWIHNYLVEQRATKKSTIYLHELINGSKIVLPKNDLIERNPILEARCQRLRREQDEREYHSMTKNVDCTRTKAPDESIAYQSK